jgi:hypothetical protein
LEFYSVMRSVRAIEHAMFVFWLLMPHVVLKVKIKVFFG